MTLSSVIDGTESRDDEGVMKNIFMMNDKTLRGRGGKKTKNDVRNFTLSLSDSLKNKPDSCMNGKQLNN